LSASYPNSHPYRVCRRSPQAHRSISIAGGVLLYFLSYCFLSLAAISRALKINASLVFLYMKSTVKYLPASDCPKAIYTSSPRALAFLKKPKLTDSPLERLVAKVITNSNSLRCSVLRNVLTSVTGSFTRWGGGDSLNTG